MRNTATWKLLGLTVLFATGLCFAPAPADACMACICVDEACNECVSIPKSTAPPEGFDFFDSVVLRFPDRNQDQPTRAEIGIYGYSTTHIENGFACVVAMPKVPGIASVDSVVNYNTLTGEPLPGLTFTSNPSTSEEVGQMMYTVGVGEGEPWFTYVSHITQAVDDGIPNHFVVEVTLDGETTPDQLLRNLQEQGVLITGSSDQAGVPNGGHLFIKKMGKFDMIALYPPIVPEEPVERGTRLSPRLP